MSSYTYMPTFSCLFWFLSFFLVFVHPTVEFPNLKQCHFLFSGPAMSPVPPEKNVFAPRLKKENQQQF